VAGFAGLPLIRTWPPLHAAAARAGKPIDKHRDGTQGIYVDDPAGNVVELIYYPAGGTAYKRPG